MRQRYYTDLYSMDDKYRRDKYKSLLLSSLTNDLNKWTKHLFSDKVHYYSPKYNDQYFTIEIRTDGVEIAYVSHKQSIISGETIKNELIHDGFSGPIKNAIDKLRENIYEDDLSELDKLIGHSTKTDRKEKLQFIEIEHTKELIEDTFKDWEENDNSVSAKFIAKIIYSYRTKEELYNLWMGKFSKIEMISDELSKLKK